MQIKFLKSNPDCKGIVEIDGEITICADEAGTVAFGQHYAFKTGVSIAVPKGKIAIVSETASMGFRGITVTGKFITCNDLSEVRIGLFNGSRTAFPVALDQPIARLILVDSDDLSLDECPDKDTWDKMVKETLANLSDSEKEQAELHSTAVLHGPATTPKSPKPPANSGTKSNDAKPENIVPKSEDVDAHNVAKDAALKAGNPPPQEPVPGNALQNTKTNQPATV